ncbi:MAG: DUF1800 domain-containing protein [Paracoccaceae bacterium]|nr:MAG: DUF1800 domain-containing protein [Paracoccaceae bacterium]
MLALLAGPDATATAIPAPRGPEVFPAIVATFAARRARRDAIRAGTPEGDELRETAAVVRGLAIRAARARMARALDATDGFRERLVRFWADHFTVRPRVGPDQPLPGVLIEDAIRPNLTGRFADLLTAVTMHPAMLSYLDQVGSMGPNSPMGKQRKRGLNENLARELIELHTLGVGAAYTQADIRQLAELLTGLGVDSETGTVFRRNWAEPGPETVLGKTYGDNGIEPIRDVLNDLALHPETAAHIGRKLAVHFVSDTPDPGIAATIGRAFADTGGDLMAVYGALLDHPAAWAPELGKTRQPYDLVLASLRVLGVTGAQVLEMPEKTFRHHLLSPMSAMGQPWQRPRGPDGWPEEAEAWITPQLLAARIAFAMETPRKLVPDLPEPVVLARTALGPLADGRLLWAVERAETRPEAVGLVLASPMFNRR